MLAKSILRSSFSLCPRSRWLASQAHFSTTNHVIINAVGRDRTGIVSDVTGTVLKAGGNIGPSQATRLGNEYFAVMMMVDVPSSNIEKLKEEMESLLPRLKVVVYEADDEEEKDSTSGTAPLAYAAQFNLDGADNPGLVHRFTSVLANHGLSIDMLTTTKEVAPHGGTTLFQMQGRVTAVATAKSFNEKVVQEELSKLGEALNCDVQLESFNVQDSDEPKCA